MVDFHRDDTVLQFFEVRRILEPAATAMAAQRMLLDLTPALVLGTCSFYTMFKRAPVGKLLVSVCTNVSCLVNGGPTSSTT